MYGNIVPINFNTSAENIKKTIENQRLIERTLVLNQIKIKNIEKWDGAKAKDFIQVKSDITVDKLA